MKVTRACAHDLAHLKSPPVCLREGTELGLDGEHWRSYGKMITQGAMEGSGLIPMETAQHTGRRKRRRVTTTGITLQHLPGQKRARKLGSDFVAK